MILEEIKVLWPKDLTCLTQKHGTEIRILIKNYQDFQEKKMSAEDLIFESRVVLDHTWEKLNVGKWIDVPVEVKQVYSIAAFIQVIALLENNKPDALKKSLETIDLGILLGSPFQNLDLTKVADVLSEHVRKESNYSTEKRTIKRLNSEAIDHSKRIKLENEIHGIERPSLEFFNNYYFSKKEPAKLISCINHWPALQLWNDSEYIKTKAGGRTVPIELGAHYADSSYSQKLMKISDFIDQFFGQNSERMGYLAQHQLFDQVPELKKDISIPDYCALSENYEDGAPDVDINAWFGPKGTVSPLHFDPKHNLLCQIAGTKKIILYPEKESQYLYPHENSLLFNTSRVDVENPDHDTFPEFKKATKKECLLQPGDVLYIPPKYWHHVRALDNSFSVSFWWE